MSPAEIRKAITAALGLAVTLVLLVPEELVPEQWRPWVGVILALGTVAGVYRVKNDPPARHGPTTKTPEELADQPPSPPLRPLE